jgi:thiol-disulfide isomerase/thioredoxin
MSNSKRGLIWGIVILLVIVGGIVYAVKHDNSTPGKYDQFATCLKDKGMKFYGAFWCPHCQAMKQLFGTSARLLPYIECSTPDGSSQNGVCNNAKIEGYPTWEFADGSRLTGELPLATLAEKTGCTLPQ